MIFHTNILLRTVIHEPFQQEIDEI